MLASVYESLEHQQFCNKWQVSGEMGDYPIWRQMLFNIKALLDDGHFLRLVDEIENQFGLTKPSQVVDVADERYDQLFDDGIPGKVPKQINDEKTDIKNQPIKELEIWTLSNLRIVFADYFFSLSDAFLLERYESTIQYTLLPLIHHVINPVYAMSGRKTIDEKEIVMLVSDVKSDVADILAKRASAKTTTMHQSTVALTFNRKQPNSYDSESQADTSDSMGTKTGPSILR
jgi:hypothetical protein